ncbi:MAG: signal peptidase I [Myxococcota bacterium]
MGVLQSGFGCLSWIGAGIIVILLILKVVFFDMADMGHNGMAPTLLRGERVIINKRAEPKLNAIAVCQHPSEEGWVVGRVVATEGQTIGSFGEELRIDGAVIPFDERGITDFYNEDNELKRSVKYGTEKIAENSHTIFLTRSEPQHLVRKTTVESGKLFLLGDYRGYMGQDSRPYGQVDASSCRGAIVFRLTPMAGLPHEIAHGYFQVVH